MRVRTLITQRLYFGMDAMTLRAGMGRVLARCAGVPIELTRVSARHLHQDFMLGEDEGNALINQFVDEGLLKAPNEKHIEYRLSSRFLDYASARVVEPLERERAKQLLQRACRLAELINAEWKRNPLEVAMLAPFGSYMSRDELLEELPLGIVVRARGSARRARWVRASSKLDGAREIRAAMRGISSFMRIRLATETSMLPRPFAVAFQAQEEEADSPFLVLPAPTATESRA